MGLKPPGLSTSMFSLGEGDDFRRAMQAADLPFFNERPLMPQDPIFSAFPRSKSVSDDMGLTDHCACIGNQAKFLSTLKKMEGKYSPAPVPVILQATQDSRVLWERLMHCSCCRRDRDSVAVLMFAMGLRNIIRGLQCLMLNHQSSQHSIPHPNSGQHAISGHGPAAFSNGSTTHINGVNNRDMIFDNINHRSSTLMKDTIRVGSFEVPQEEQAFLTDVLIARALSKIKSILESMMGYLERVSDSSFQSQHGEKWPVHFVLEDLQRSVLVTEGSVREIIQR
ncbi:uncharacterized protein N7473_012167 [Penicillium subrubescens]|nr:uncharacterized protein N7473_012167 [Penicillium subrubescens]KAJ5881114.1 hypothetical protein N7473_012167 [Penicillium subrubescens]